MLTVIQFKIKVVELDILESTFMHNVGFELHDSDWTKVYSEKSE